MLIPFILVVNETIGPTKETEGEGLINCQHASPSIYKFILIELDQ